MDIPDRVAEIHEPGGQFPPQEGQNDRLAGNPAESAPSQGGFFGPFPGLQGLQTPLWPCNNLISPASASSSVSVTSGPWLLGGRGQEEVGSKVGFLSLPSEVHTKILEYLDPEDLLAYSRVSRTFYTYSLSQQVWKRQWIKLSRKTPFTFLPVQSLVELGVNFKDCCRRLWKVMVNETAAIGGLSPAKCLHCKEFTCTPACIEEVMMHKKVALDIGGKISWLITSGYSLKRHLSMVAVPKALKCYDCDTTLPRTGEAMTSTSARLDPGSPFADAMALREDAYCRSKHVSSHTALEYCSQPVSAVCFQGSLSQPFCLFCEDDKVNWMLCEREIVNSTKERMKGIRPPYMSGEEEFVNSHAVSGLVNGYCRDTSAILGASNLDLLSPSLAMEREDCFPVVKSFVMHLLQHSKMVDDIQRPNVSFVFTYTILPFSVKEQLLNFFFEELKVARLCLLPKPLAISTLFEIKTCIVVDSGATNTFVWVVIDGKVDEERTQHLRVGGWHVSQFLQQAVSWQGNQDTVGATVSSLDTSAVKQKCRLSLNLSREGDHRSGSSRSETLHIKSQRDSQRRLELTEVTLSSELYLAPEMMYGSLDLPGMVQEAVRDLPDPLLKDCFSHILLTGGNTNLQGFYQRFSSDLRELMPEHSPVINVCPYPTGNHSWNSVMGANAVKIPTPYEDVLHLNEAGSPLWMSREEYITFGSTTLAQEGAVMKG